MTGDIDSTGVSEKKMKRFLNPAKEKKFPKKQKNRVLKSSKLIVE